MYIVYGLEDQRSNEIFYVGITDDIQSRFLQHLRCDGTNPGKDAIIQGMVCDGYLPLLRTLQLVANREQAKRRESYWMRHFYDMGIQLYNQIIPIISENAVLVTEADIEPRLKAQMTIDEQKEYILFLLNSGTSKRKILEKIDGYIHPKTAYTVIDRSIGLPERLQSKTQKSTESTAVHDSDKLKKIKGMLRDKRTQQDIVCEVWNVPTSGRAFNAAVTEYREILSSLLVVEE